ncbi:DUF1294 domain-containing protein [Sphingomonas sp. RT2P30]|uniref:DUF1294 domain-containing protein n=1 Tax=Parasphingomonas halimpatiens TaxID=3096162 RepID=UPI003FA6B78E
MLISPFTAPKGAGTYRRRMLLLLAVPALLLINAFTVLRFWQDKQRAIAGAWPIPESDLLALALVGGSPGALLARRLFRHKTRKEPFSTLLLLIAMAQVGALVGYLLARP